MGYRQQYPMVTATLDRLAIKRVANELVIKVHLKETFGISPLMSSYHDAIRQIERHVDDVEMANVFHDDVEYQSLADPKVVYSSRASALVSEGMALEQDGVVELIEVNNYRARYKRTASEEAFTFFTHGTYEQVICAAFDNEVFEITLDEYSMDELRQIQAVRKLRESLSTSK